MIKDAWNSVTQTTIINCFKHVNIINSDKESNSGSVIDENYDCQREDIRDLSYQDLPT